MMQPSGTGISTSSTGADFSSRQGNLGLCLNYPLHVPVDSTNQRILARTSMATVRPWLEITPETSKGRELWSLIRGSAIWLTWIDRTSTAFDNEVRSQPRLETTLWDAVIDHGRAAWLRTTLLIKQYPAQKRQSSWCTSTCFGTRRHAG